MQVLVQHQEFNNDTGEVIGFTDVARVNVSPIATFNQALEYAWRYTNNVMGSWSKKIGGDANDDVEVLYQREDGMGLRSSMVGDRFILDGKTYKVAFAGFEEVV